MEPGELIAVAAILIAFFALMWQMHSQNGKLDAKIEAQGAAMRALSVEMRAQDEEMRAEMRAEFRSLRESLESRLDLDSRLRTVEREQAASARRESETSTGD